MERDFLQELGGKIGIVEEVEIDYYGECIGEFVRIRISIYITQPLEKILFLKQKGDEGCYNGRTLKEAPCQGEMEQ